MKTLQLTILLLIFHLLPASGQTSNLFTTKKELSSSMINQVYSDKKGFVWIATESGLSKYDGSKFITYKHSRSDSNSLLNNYVRTLFENQKGDLYIGGLKGLQRYNYETEDFTTIPMVTPTNETVSAHVQNIIELKDHSLLISTSGRGIQYLLPGQDTIYTGNSKYYVPAIINASIETPDGSVWLATESDGVLQIKTDGNITKYLLGSRHELTATTCLCLDGQNNLYAGTNGNGLFVFDKAQKQFTRIMDPSISNKPIKALYMNSPEELYIGTDGYGLRIYDTRKKEFKPTNLISPVFDLQNSKVHSIAKDKYDNLWLGIFQKGVLLLPHKATNFTYWGQNSPHFNIIGENCVMAIFQDQEGSIWVGTDNDGIYKLNSNGELISHFRNTASPRSVPSTVLCFYEDSQGNLWIGSFMQGMAKINRKTGECSYITLTDTKNNPAQRIYSIVEDNNRRLWIGTMGQGVFCLDLNTNRVTPFPETEDKLQKIMQANILPNYWINQLHYSKSDNCLYLGTFGGLCCLDLDSMTFIKPFGGKFTSGNTVVNAILIDSRQNCWLGTSDGITLYNLQTKETSEFTTRNGLPSNYISALQEDHHGNIWISTNQGIAQYKADSHQFTSYTNELQNNEFSRGAAFTNASGEIFFGGTMGIIKFMPDQIIQPQSLPEVRITGFYLHNERINKNSRSGRYEIVEHSIYEASRLNLSHNDNSFTIEFSMADFSKPEVYTYSMNEGPWIIMQPGTNQISFSELNPGKYTFRVKARNYSLESAVKEITIYIHPAWYESGWAVCLYIMAGAAVLILVFMQIRHHYKTRQEIMEHVHAEEINEAKLQFFINISHEIRTPMSLIINPLKELMSTDHDKEHQKKYNLINRNALRILHLINQLMDIRKIEKGQMRLTFSEADILEFTRNLTETLSYQATSKQISLQVLSELDGLNVWIDPEYFDKILMNLLWNALKYTPQGGEIKVHINRGNNPDADTPLQEYAELIVEDNGPGIDENEIEKIFQRFYQVKQANHPSGTGIGLHLTRSLVLLHHGTISVENNKDRKGCRFIVRLPLGKSHLSAEEISNVKTVTVIPTENIPEAIDDTFAQDTQNEKIRSKTKYVVLIAEDEEEIRNYLEAELGAYFTILTCTNGKDALETALRQKVNLIVSDVMMPEMDGLTLCQKLKHNINTNEIPVILLTAKVREEDNLSGITSGADAYLTKPFNLEILRATIENLIRNREILKNNYKGNQTQDDKIEPIAVNDKSPDEKLMERVMKIMNENISNPELNVEMIAQQVGISRVHLYRKLKELTNQSTRDFIRNTRLKQAAILLTEKNKNVSEAALLVGFNNINYFSSVFKDFYGVPPTVYVERYRQQKVTGKAE